MAFVYWIRLPSHSDIFKDGYVGMTTKTVNKRFSEHLTKSRSKKTPTKSILSSALVKYNENVIVETVCECDAKYALYLENKLRPSPLIGWNILAGGGETVGRLGLPQTEKQKLAASKASKGRSPPEHVIKKASETNKSRVRSDEELLKRSLAIKSKHILDLPTTNLDVLSRVNDIYTLYLEGLRVMRISNKLSIPMTGMRSLFSRFSEGYNPISDTRLQDFITSYNAHYGIYTLGNESGIRTNSFSNICTGVFKNKSSYVAYIGTGTNRKSKAFNIHKLGDETARELAIEYRKQLEIELTENAT